MQLTLGPVPFFWPKDQILDFYHAMAQQPLARIYLGETICSKRREMRTQDWLDLAQMLTDQGVEVVLSTLTLLEAESELKTLTRLCKQDNFLVEANDMGAINLLHQQGKAFVSGPAINIYNGISLRKLQSLGLQRWVMPVELSATALQETLAQAQSLSSEPMPETEVFAYGQLPLAYAARCFTARHRNLAKDDCGFCCIEYPQGIELASQDGSELFIMNGIQTMSAKTYDLCDQVSNMQDMGITALRISPNSMDLAPVITRFQQAIAGQPVASAQIRLNDITSGNCNGYWYGRPGMDQID
ncbi:MAG: U32 family peptidase [Gammaproteobacteria bacterium]|jgi:collagenase-like PrtC family protease|nr:U32 family peptidase [Gammaproteobacteria bacterium]